jgi:hypothetical protein
LTIGEVIPKVLNKMMLTRRILEVPNAMNVQDTITCGNLEPAKGKALNTTLSDDSEEEETPCKDPKFLAFTASYNDPEESKSYYSESSDEEDLKEVYKTLFIKFMKLREVNQKNVLELNIMQTEKSTLLQKIKGLEDGLFCEF